MDYNHFNGEFYWKVSTAIRVKVGDIAGSVGKRGYRRIRIKGKNYRAHRLAFLYMTGEFPINQVDHINHKRDDNRFINLRHVSQQDNGKNLSISVRNKSGFTGVYWAKDKNKWRAQIRIKGKLKHLGYFKDLGEATNCKKMANFKYGFHLNHGT